LPGCFFVLDGFGFVKASVIQYNHRQCVWGGLLSQTVKKGGTLAAVTATLQVSVNKPVWSEVQSAYQVEATG
jgi:hypothetical protein